jgi:hypothetical protein
MARILCPKCGREAVGLKGIWSGAKPRCPACGWNVDRARASERRNLKVVAIYLAGIAFLFAASALRTRGTSGAPRVGLILFTILLLLGAFASWRRWRTLDSGQATSSGAAPSAPSAFKPQAKAAPPVYESLFMLRRPRTLRLKWSARIFAIASSIVLAGVGYSVFLAVERGGAKGPIANALPNFLSFAMFGLIWLIISGALLRGVVRDRSLLADGEIAIATVTSQSFSGDENRGSSKIVYEFKDATGRTFSGKAHERTRTLFEEMQTPVFYDPLNPAKNVPLIGAAYDVVDS